MIRFLQWLFQGCAHEWENIHEGPIKCVDNHLQVGRWYDCRCKKCGKMKRYNMTV